MEKRSRATAPESTPEQTGSGKANGALEDVDHTAFAAEPTIDGSPDAPASGAGESELYGRLSAPFGVTFRDLRGGVELEYITGEQATTRLNETLGFMNWSFRVVEHGIHAEADECWVLGELSVTMGGRTVSRQQFGSQKVKRSRSSGTPLDIGFDLKGAATDALKKCASLIGVALYLWKKEPPVGYDASANGSSGQNGAGQSRQANIPSLDLDAPNCEECGEPLTETRFKDGTNWPPAQLAVFGRRKHSRILCMTHYREANQAKRRAEEALQQVPF